MSEAIDTAVTKLTAGMEAAIKAVGNLGEKYGPEVVDSALWVVRFNGISNIVSDVVGVLAGGAAAFFMCRWVTDHIREVQKEDSTADLLDCNPGVIIPGAFSGVIAAIVAVSCAISLAGVWNWVAIFEPKLWVAKRLLGL